MTDLVFHVGMMKTATTYLQNILRDNRASLAAQGWCYPGEQLNQQRIFYEMCGSDIDWVEHAPRNSRRTAMLRAALSDESANRIVSAEALANLNDDGIARLFTLVPSPTKVVITIRSFSRIVPSAWQQVLKTGYEYSLDTFAERFISEFKTKRGTLFRTYAFGEAAQRWHLGTGAPIAILKVSSVRSDKNKIWHDFRSATGLPNIDLEPPALEKSNVSLSMGACEVVRRFNASSRNKGLFSKRMLAVLIDDGFMSFPAIELDAARPCLPEAYVEALSYLEAIEWEKAAAIGAHVMG